MDMSRKEFGAAVGSTLVLLFLQACGGGGGYSSSSPAPAPAPGSPPPPPAPAECGASGGEIAGNHGHVLAINRADLDSATPVTYGIMGTADHTHNVTFSPAQLQTLKTGGTVTVASTTTLQHNHNVTATCL